MRDDGIEVIFGGAPATFKLSRDTLDTIIFEAALGSPAEALARLRSSAWTVADIRTVLTFACVGEPYRFRGFSARVDEVLEEHPPGQFVELAASVLERFLFGAKAEAAWCS
jgi:hypothetical protein